MSLNRLIGVFLLIIGIVFFVIGVNATQSVTETIGEKFTGHYGDKTMLYLFVGALMLIAGGILGFRRSK